MKIHLACMVKYPIYKKRTTVFSKESCGMVSLERIGTSKILIAFVSHLER